MTLPDALNMQEFDRFLLWERTSRDTIDFKKIYVDMAGDLNAGLMLSEIVYWYLPSKDGQVNKLRVSHKGHQWIARRRYEWWERIRLTPKEVDRALAILIKKGIVAKATFKFDGEPTVHVRLIVEVFMKLWTEIANNPPENPHLPKAAKAARAAENQENPRTFLPKVKNEITEKVKRELPKGENPVTKTTAQNTTDSLYVPDEPEGTEREMLSPFIPVKDEANSRVDLPSTQMQLSMISAWAEGLGDSKPLRTDTADNRKYANVLIRAGYTPDDVKAYVTEEFSGEYWQRGKGKGGYLSLSTVVDRMPKWMSQRRKQQEQEDERHDKFAHQSTITDADMPYGAMYVNSQMEITDICGDPDNDSYIRALIEAGTLAESFRVVYKPMPSKPALNGKGVSP